MPKKKTAERCAVPAWASARIDNREKRFIQVGNSLFFDRTFQELSPGAKVTYLAMMMECAGRREFQFPHAAARKYNIPPRSFDRYMRELVMSGFISCQSGANTREPNVYAFQFGWKQTPIEPP